MTDFIKGRAGKLMLASGTLGTLSSEPMRHVDLSADIDGNRPLYTVYEITDENKRALDDGTVPVFKADTGNDGNFQAITPYRIEYPDCRIFLTTPRGATDHVICYSGKYLPLSTVLGVEDFEFKGDWSTKTLTLMRDSAERTIPLQPKWNAAGTLRAINTMATLTTALVGSQNNITFRHAKGGTAGNGATGGYTVTYNDPGGPTATLGISISGNDITVNLGRATGAINTKAIDIVDIWGRNAILREYELQAWLKDGETGAGVVTEMTKANLSGGLDPVDYTSISDKAVAVFYSDYDTKTRRVDYARIPSSSIKAAGNDILSTTINFVSWGGANCGPFYRRF
jgi:hypothetical protein